MWRRAETGLNGKLTVTHGLKVRRNVTDGRTIASLCPQTAVLFFHLLAAYCNDAFMVK